MLAPAQGHARIDQRRAPSGGGQKESSLQGGEAKEATEEKLLSSCEKEKGEDRHQQSPVAEGEFRPTCRKKGRRRPNSASTSLLEKRTSAGDGCQREHFA
ncbi:UNVERIFIED_CONTAM: hypothetical protein HHA_452030 [Hammondia hammondi]|eukprot:XP_008885006.1 hypothetical protein HHA_452030 [Hammondia hammondi]